MTPEAKTIITQLRAARTIADSGTVRLVDMKVGGKLLGYNGVWNTIKEVARKKYRGKFYLLNGHTLVFQDQTICQPDNSFRLPHELKIGDLLCKKDGTEEIATIEIIEGKYRFYHPTLDGDHTFYLNDILVHNATNDFDQVAGEWNTATNWSLDHVALNTEDTTFTGLNGSAALTITTTTAAAKSVDFSTAGAAFTLSGSANFTVYGSLTCKTGMTWSHSGALSIAYTANGLITSNSVSLGSSSQITIGVNATGTLADPLNTGIKQIVVRSGGSTTTFVTADKQIDCGLFNDGSGAGSVTLTLGTSQLNVSNINFSAATLTVNHTGIVNLTTVAAGLTTSFGQGTVSGTGWGTVNYLATPTAAAVYTLQFPTAGANLLGLNISYAADRRDGSFTINNNFSLATSSTWKGGGIGFDNPIMRPLISAFPFGTAKTITVSAASQTMTFTDVDFRDIVVATTNTPTITGTRVGDCGGNTNVDTDAPKTVYAGNVGAARNWYDTIWAAAVGSSYADRAAAVDINQYPLPQDTAIFDDYTFSGSRTVTVNGYRIGGITAVDALSTAQTLATAGGGEYYGSVELTSFNLTVIGAAGARLFDARVAGTQNINILSSGISTAELVINSYGGTVRLLTNNLTHTGNFTLTRGTFDVNGKTLSTNTYNQSNSNTRVLQSSAAGGKIVTKALTGIVFNTDTPTGLTVKSSDDAGFYDIAVDIGTSNLTQSADVTFSGGGKKYGDFKVTKHAGNFDCEVTGANTLGVVTLETPDGTYAYSGIASATSQAITSLVADGTATEKITIQIPLVDTAGTNTVTNCTITNSAVSGGAKWLALLSAGNTNVSGNTGWTWTQFIQSVMRHRFIPPFLGGR
jgi:hypothetical protein